MHEFDLVVIGGGSAGLTAAVEAVGAGARVALVERSGRYGGTCRYVGCVPSKVLLHTAQILHTMRTGAAQVGLPTVDPAWDFKRVMQHKDDVILRAGGDDGYDAPSDFYNGGGRSFTGDARFRDAHELQVGDEVLRAAKFVIATGSRPRIPPIEGLADAGYHTWETIFDLDELPQSLLIIGGGPLGTEFSQIFRRFGSEVTVIEMSDDILPQADPDAAQALRSVLEHEGVQFRCGVEINGVRRDGKQRVISVRDGDRNDDLRGDLILVAIGPQPNTETLNLPAAGVELTDKGAIVVDDQLRTTAKHIYACGDVATKYQFTHIALYEGTLVAQNAVENAERTVDERVVPWSVYTEPSLAHVGLTEQQAHDQKLDIVSATIPVSSIERSLLVNEQAGLIKAVARRDTGELLGVDIVSARADDLIHEAALAVRLRLSVRDIANTIHAYPTFSQGLQQIMEELNGKLATA